jgi:hypothetical protein
MRPRSSSLPPVGLVLPRQVILEKAQQVLEYVDMLAPRAHSFDKLRTAHAEAFHEHGPYQR